MADQNEDGLVIEGLSAKDFNLNLEQKDPRPLEERKKGEVSEVLKKFKNLGKAEQQLFLDNVDSEYWIAICFQSREQKEAFLELAGWLQFGDKYLDGLEVAQKMGIRIAHMTPPIRKVSMHKDWSEFVRVVGAAG